MNVPLAPSGVLPLAAWLEAVSSDPDDSPTQFYLPGAHVPDAGLLAAAGLGAGDRARVAAILERNVASGRAARIMQRMSAAGHAHGAPGGSPCPDEARWLAYQRRVAQTFAAERERLLALEGGDDAAWGALERQLERSARRMLTHQGAGGAYAEDRAAELAQQTCVQIFKAVYPCDVAFDPWSHTVLRNVVRAARTRSHDVLDRAPFVRSLDEWQERADGDEVGVGPFLGADGPCADAAGELPGASANMQALIDAIQQMRSANRRAVLVYTYFLGLDDGEIAEKLGRNRDGVQVLRHRALRQLRALVEQDDC
jgi:RNA polymerase sigma factor (sigma-70 family)